jgi:hypothetical protein
MAKREATSNTSGKSDDAAEAEESLPNSHQPRHQSGPAFTCLQHVIEEARERQTPQGNRRLRHTTSKANMPAMAEAI